MDYKDAGVDVNAGYEAVRLIKQHVARTFIPGVIGDIGSFSGLFAIDKDAYKEPVLVSGADGVGTKLKIAFALDRHDTVGIDCVAMCVNDILCQGAKPLFFLDYLATGKLEPAKAAKVVKGVADGCMEAGCALIGGETAEMPDMYAAGEYDLAGFAVGIVDRDNVITGQRIQKGDALIGLASSGVHSNGFSLVRRLLMDKLDEYSDELDCTFGEELIKPTRIYVKPVLEALKAFDIKGMAHITGGGFIENIPRMLNKGLTAVIDRGAWHRPPIFQILQRLSGLDDTSMFNTFNMGIGLVMALPPNQADGAVAFFENVGCQTHIIGSIEEGPKGIRL
ncbi:phosphoribosylformylglycinamidine cyclo-ligase [Mahella australiensis]|uniref:Phosphoribosylformylglycinamidine cyclo-ligase n=1 Tax=Mahella australiensis (strain DSM 15567 / CIP 107919 / 50-1 BON) TaxID=697281 RepID=F3ZZI8_MAHA5|nr:phosphoribosylformylglycinamidine cyclo-ligase [Mahella australiensis]AEE96814.1 phosphoribosylformylglycinamidine cyclo-ligase [Mahella australiensis 50-1 BON]